MAQNLDSVVRSIAEVGNWTIPVADNKGRYTFLLDRGMDLTLETPDGIRCIFSSDVGLCPDSENFEGSEQLREIGRQCAAVFREHRAVLSVDTGRLILHRTLTLSDLDPDRAVDEARQFLNEEEWWRETLSTSESTSNKAGFVMNADEWLKTLGTF